MWAKSKTFSDIFIVVLLSF